MNATETAYVESLESENTHLKEQLEWFKRHVFGKRDERIVNDLDAQQLYLEGLEPQEAPPQKATDIPAHKRSKKKSGNDKITIPPDLPVRQTILDLPDEDKVCPNTGKPLVKIGEEVSHKLAYQPGSYFIKEIIRPKYALPAGEGILTAELPDSLLTRCRADESLLADIIVRKYADHLPLYRICEAFSRQNIGISRQLLSQWILGAGHALEPLYNEMVKQIMESGNIFIDETPVKLQAPGKGKLHQAYMWVISGGQQRDPPYRAYFFRQDRRHEHAKELLKGYQGVVHSDKYGAYERLADQFTWCPCWSHIRRKFFDATGDPPFCNWVLMKIRHLFLYERIAWSRSAEERLQIRQEKEAVIIDQLSKAIRDKLVAGHILPKSKLKEALGYFSGLIPYLKNYTQHAYARLDNNVAERAVRPLAIGRKNWLFVGSVRGGQAAATLLSLVQTCRALGINSHEYLEDVMRRLMSHNSQRLHELLPDHWARECQDSDLPD